MTELQVQEWLSHPVTQAYLEALDQHNLAWQAAGAAASPSITADQTHAAVARREGILLGIQQAGNPMALMDQYELIEAEEEQEDAA